VARDVAARGKAHAGPRQAAYTRSRRPVTLVYQEPAANRSAALRREWAIKQLTRTEKAALIMAAPRVRPAADAFTAFRPAALTFFNQLKRHNTKPWFEEHKAVYQQEVLQPLKALVEEVDVAFARFAPEITGNPGRSPFRIYRDVRFSKDKTPYKIHAACWFYHQDAGRGVGGDAEGGAGFYFHFAPTGSQIAAGIWMPPRSTLAKLRDAIVEDQQGFERIVLAPGFRRRYSALSEEAMLKRMPRGYAEEHPAARWLRHQSFTVGRPLTRAELLSPRLPRILARDFEALTPLVRWINSALGFPSVGRR
jgi:uncharacterized protein (TIGR02453 family)